MEFEDVFWPNFLIHFSSSVRATCSDRHTLIHLYIVIITYLATFLQSPVSSPALGQNILLRIFSSEFIWGAWSDINYCLTVIILSMSGAPSDERSGLSFVLVTWTASVHFSKLAAGPRQLCLGIFFLHNFNMYSSLRARDRVTYSKQFGGPPLPDIFKLMNQTENKEYHLLGYNAV
jgi:hypothetical protein